MIEQTAETDGAVSELTLVQDKAEPIHRTGLEVLGWREYVSLPDLGGYRAKAKVDSGARTSALHARNLHFDNTSLGTEASFTLGIGDDAIEVTAIIVEQRLIRSSNGQDELRPVIVTPITVHGASWDVEVTLSDRELMGFPMLLGRSAIRNRFLIDPNRSFCGGA